MSMMRSATLGRCAGSFLKSDRFPGCEPDPESIVHVLGVEGCLTLASSVRKLKPLSNGNAVPGLCRKCCGVSEVFHGVGVSELALLRNP